MKNRSLVELLEVGIIVVLIVLIVEEYILKSKINENREVVKNCIVN